MSFDLGLFQKKLETAFIGRSFLFRPVVDSTMNLARRELDEGAPSGTVVLAEMQTQGRGRFQRTWLSSPSSNLCFSIALRSSNAELLQRLNVAVPITAAQTLLAFGIQNVGLKWPNDVWVEGRKICGVLIEAKLAPTEKPLSGEFQIVVGIGLNVNQVFEQTAPFDSSSAAPNPTSMAMLLGHPYSREEVLADFCTRFERIISASSSFDKLLAEYERLDLLLGHQIMVKPKGREEQEGYIAQAIRFSPEGALVVQPIGRDTEEITLLSEEVCVRAVS